jgi:hypothetical protein
MSGSKAVKAVKERIEVLIAEVPNLATGEYPSRQRAWLVAAQNATEVACPFSNPYRTYAAQLVEKARDQYFVSSALSEMAATLARLLEEIEGGLLTTIENHAIAVTFDDFLDHGAEYLKRGRKDEAAVVAGIVFEDTIRRICRMLGVSENGVALNTLIDELAKQSVLTALKAKRARAAAGLRTSAAHARWEEIQLGDVDPVIQFTRELMSAHLG